MRAVAGLLRRQDPVAADRDAPLAAIAIAILGDPSAHAAAHDAQPEARELLVPNDDVGRAGRGKISELQTIGHLRGELRCGVWLSRGFWCILHQNWCHRGTTFDRDQALLSHHSSPCTLGRRLTAPIGVLFARNSFAQLNK